MTEVYPLLQYAHILLLVYWLGTDMGVYLSSRYVGRADLPLSERRRFLDLLIALDMGPRTALVLMIPTGTLMLWIAQWLRLEESLVAAIVSGSAAWLALVWFLHRHPSAPPVWKTLDLTLRGLVVIVMVILGGAILLGATPGPSWLGIKFLAYGGAVLCGILLRRVLAVWAIGFAELRDVATASRGNKRIAEAMGASARYAMMLWACVLIAAFCGVVKPA